MSAPWRRILLLFGASGLLLGATAPTPTLAAGSPPPSMPSARSSPPASHRVSFRGVSLAVPNDWQVIDLSADPTRCVRLDIKAIYLGEPGAQQDCPAHLVGRSESILLRPASAARLKSTTSGPTAVGRLAARTGSDQASHTKQVWFTSPNVEADVAWGADESAVDRVLSSAGPAGPAGSATTHPAPASAQSATNPRPPSTSVTASGGTAQPRLATATVTASKTYTGMGFDTCAAPSLSSMKSWFASSPYRAAGIYIGGSMRACGYGNLTSSWVSQVSSMGWGLIPVYLGLQAPCVDQAGLAHIDPSRAAAQGKASADDAVTHAQSFGLGAGTPIYYDMEGYNNTVTACRHAVLTFLSAWTTELRARGHRSGVYGSTSSVMVDMANAITDHLSGFVASDEVWFAHWNGLQTLSDSAAYPAFRDSYWWAGQRLHQYDTLTETWGGVRINIDADWLGGLVAGSPVGVSYGANVFGPGSTSFVFTGNMAYWKPNAPQGLKGRAYATYANGTTESNGATWYPQLPPGEYAVSAYIPGTRATAVARYTIRDAKGTVVRTVNQAAVTGYTSLGRFFASSGHSITVHLGDNGPSPASAEVGADAMSFHLIATVP